MWPENMTDDADAIGYRGCDPFLPNEDYDPMYEGPGYEPKCGGPEKCVGCRHCDPVDQECKPYGWGIERFESAEVYRLSREFRANADVVLGCGVGGPVWFERYLHWTGFNFVLERVSDRVWEKLCYSCETHTEAVREYEAWVKKVVGK